MLSGATCRAAAIDGTAVFKMVVSSDSMKNATATSQGKRDFTAEQSPRDAVIEYEGLGRIARRVSRLVLLRYLELCVAVGIEGDGDEIRPAAYCTVLGVDLSRATTGIHEGVVLLAAERARVGHGFSGYRNESGDKSDVAALG